MDIKLQLCGKAKMTQTKEIEQACLFILLFLSSRPCYQNEFYDIKETLLENTFSYKATFLASAIHISK